MAKDFPRTTAGKLHKIIEFQGQKSLNKLPNSTYITICFLGGFQENFP